MKIPDFLDRAEDGRVDLEELLELVDDHGNRTGRGEFHDLLENLRETDGLAVDDDAELVFQFALEDFAKIAFALALDEQVRKRRLFASLENE